MKKYNFILFGGNRLKENGPMTTVINFLMKKDINFFIITDPIHLKKLISKSETFGTYLKKKKLPYFSHNIVELKDIKKFISNDAKGISLNSVWRFDKSIIKYFKGNFYNYHAADLPTERGAGNTTWRILLNKENNISLNIHKIENTFDTGDIIFSKKIKKNFKDALPIDILKYQAKLEVSFLENFLSQLLHNKNVNFKTKVQNNNNSYYWPRLNSDLDGLINWNWDAKSIVSFIKGFSHPFNGSFSYIGGVKVRIFNAKKISLKTKFHPFQNGIIFRQHKEFFYVAAGKYAIKISLLDMIGFNKNMTYYLGKRFLNE